MSECCHQNVTLQEEKNWMPKVQKEMDAKDRKDERGLKIMSIFICGPWRG